MQQQMRQKCINAVHLTQAKIYEIRAILLEAVQQLSHLAVLIFSQFDNSFRLNWKCLHWHPLSIQNCDHEWTNEIRKANTQRAHQFKRRIQNRKKTNRSKTTNSQYFMIYDRDHKDLSS